MMRETAIDGYTEEHCKYEDLRERMYLLAKQHQLQTLSVVLKIMYCATGTDKRRSSKPIDFGFVGNPFV